MIPLHLTRYVFLNPFLSFVCITFSGCIARSKLIYVLQVFMKLIVFVPFFLIFCGVSCSFQDCVTKYCASMLLFQSYLVRITCSMILDKFSSLTELNSESIDEYCLEVVYALKIVATLMVFV